MWTLTTILTIGFCIYSPDYISFQNDENMLNEVIKHCSTEKDSLTKKTIYTSVDKQAINEGGQIALLHQYEKIILDSFPADYDTKFIVAFVVETDGQIIGERVIKDKVGNIGQQMIKIAKSFNWTPAECDGRKVPMLVKIPLQMCLE